MDLVGLHLLFLTSYLGLASAWNANTLNSGLKIQITQKGLQYAAQQALDVIAADLRGKSIPDQSGDAHVPVVGHISYSVTGMRINSFSRPQTSVTTAPFHWHIGNVGAQIHGDWRYKNHGWIRVSDHGSFDISLSGWSLDTTLSMGVDSNGRPTVKSMGCTCGAGGLSIKLHGGASWLYDLFKGNIARSLKNQLVKQLCSSVDKAINVNAAQELASLRVTVPLDKKIELDYRLIRAPQFSTKYIESYHKGEIFWTGDTQEAPFSAPSLPEIETSMMLTIWLSEYVMNTLGYVEFKHGTLKYIMTRNDLPEKDQVHLSTTCSRTQMCIGNLIPQLAKQFPNASVALDMSVTKAPFLNISAKTGLSGVFIGTVGFNVVSPNKPQKFAFSAKLSVTFDLTVAIVGMNATVDITTFKVSDLQVVKSDIGPVQLTGLNFMMKFAVNSFVIPKLKELGKHGMELPNIAGVQYVNPKIAMAENAIVILTDAKYII